MKNLLNSGLLVEEGMLKNILQKIRENLSVFSSGVEIRKVGCYGNILVCEDAVSVFICEVEKGKVIRSPKTGTLLHVEKHDSVEGVIYYIFYQTPDGVIVDKVSKDRFDSRRNLTLNSKFEISKMYSSPEYILIIDSENNLELISKKDIYLDELNQTLKSRSHVLYRELLFGSLSRMISSFYSADVLSDQSGVTVFVAGGFGKHVFKIKLHPDSLKPLSPIEKVTSISSSSSIDLRAVGLFERVALAEGIEMKSVRITSAASDSGFFYISIYNKTSRQHEHMVLQHAPEEPVGVKIALRFSTEKSFNLRKVIRLNYTGGGVKSLAIESDPAGTFIRYILINSETFATESSGSSRVSAIELSMLNAALEVTLDEIQSIIEETPVEETDEYVE